MTVTDDKAQKAQKLSRPEMLVLAEIHQGSAKSGANLRRTFFDSFPHKRRRAQGLMWDGLIEHAPGGYLRLTQRGKIALKA